MVKISLVREVFQKALDLDPNYALTEQSSFEEVPGWDSVGHMKLVLEIEELLGAQLEMEEIVGLDTVEKIKELIAGRQSQ